MHRRAFLISATLGLGGLAIPKPANRVMTVRGPVDSSKLGLTLMHEHILVDFIGADKVRRDRYDSEEVFRVALPHLKRIRGLGCRTFVDCTPNRLGRDVKLLERLSRASGLNIITNTGYYGARDHQFLPAHVATETPEQLAARWIGEFERGINGTGIKPGFIKIGVDAGPLSELNRKIVTAAALTHLKTGLTIGAHTGNGEAALQQLDLIGKPGVSPDAFIWIHAQSEKDSRIHLEAVRRGCWLEFDGISPSSLDRHLELVTMMKKEGYLDRVLISQDAGWYHVGEPGGGNYRGYDLIFTAFVPALKKAGFTASEIDRLLIQNPARALGAHAR